MLTSQTLLNNFTSTNQSSAQDSLGQLGEDYTKFLTLLTAQIQNQDPLEPVDSTQFVDGTTSTSYEVGAGAAEVTAKIYDPLGRNVRTINGLSTVSGTANPLGWDGKDDYGNAQLAGKYTVVLTAKDAAGNNIAIEPSRSARVEDVRFREGEIIFGLDGGETASSITVKSAS